MVYFVGRPGYSVDYGISKIFEKIPWKLSCGIPPQRYRQTHRHWEAVTSHGRRGTNAVNALQYAIIYTGNAITHNLLSPVTVPVKSKLYHAA